MLNLSDSSVLRIVTGNPVSAINVHASFIDLKGQGAASVVNPDEVDLSPITTATTTVIVPSPPVTAPTTDRNVKFVSVYNSSGSSCTITIQHFDGENAVPIFPTIDLPPGWIIQYNSDGAGWVVIDQFGRIQVSQAIVVPGILALSAGTQLATSGTIAFGNSNGVTFGMSGSSLITASVNAIASVNLSAGTTSENLTNFVLSNSNNVSFGLAGSTVTASASFSQSTAPGALAAGTQTATSGTVVFANSNGVTFGMSGNSQVTASFAQSTAPAAISAGTTLASSGTVVFSNSNGVSFGLAGNTVTASVAVASINVSAGTTSGAVTAVTFANSNNVSFGFDGSNVTATATIASSQGSVNLSAGTTSNLASAFTFSNSNGVSFGLNASTLTASVATSLTAINVSAGTSSANLSALTFSNSNGLSFGLAGSVITASVNVSALDLAAIAAGTQTATSGTVAFVNSNGVTFGMSGSSQITASIASMQGSVNLSAGTTSNLASAFTFSNSNGVSFGLNASTITASFGQSIAIFSQDAAFATNFSFAPATLSLQKVSFPMNLMATQMAVVMDLEGVSNASGALTISHAVYTLSGGTASLASSASRQISWTTGSATTATSVFGGASGTRYRTVGINYSLTPGDYLFAWAFQTTNAGSWVIFGRGGMQIVGTFDGFETAYFLNGSSVSSVAAFPASVAASDTGYARTGANVLLQPGVIFVGTGG